MNELIENRIENAKEIREKLIADGYTITIPWEEVESAMRFNFEQQLKNE